MRFFKWLWVVVVLGAIAGATTYAKNKKKIHQIRKETRKIVRDIQAKREVEVEKARGVSTVSDARGSIGRMLGRARRKKRPDN